MGLGFSVSVGRSNMLVSVVALGAAYAHSPVRVRVTVKVSVRVRLSVSVGVSVGSGICQFTRGIREWPRNIPVAHYV